MGYVQLLWRPAEAAVQKHLDGLQLVGWPHLLVFPWPTARVPRLARQGLRLLAVGMVTRLESFEPGIEVLGSFHRPLNR